MASSSSAYAREHKSDPAAFVRRPREMRRKFGRVAIVVDKVPQHRATVAGDYLVSCCGATLLSGPSTGLPRTNAMEEA